jgi:hypothetical protein
MHFIHNVLDNMFRLTFCHLRGDIVIIIIIIIIVSFMQGLHTHIPETNHIPGEYTVAAILSLLSVVPLSLVPSLAQLQFYISTFRSVCCAHYGCLL